MPVFDKCHAKGMNINLHINLRVQGTTILCLLKKTTKRTWGIATMIDKGINKQN
jgi:hypothetical protein